MNQNQKILVEALQRCGLADASGALLYSGLETLCPGELYLLGYNPGGNPESDKPTVSKHLLALSGKPIGWSEYVNESWDPGGRKFPPGQSGMQQRVRNLLGAVGYQTCKVTASNLIFARSRVADAIEDATELAEKCWPVHLLMLDIVKPRSILTIGKKAFLFISSKSNVKEPRVIFSSGLGKLKCYATKVMLQDRMINLVSVPHLGERFRYDICNHREVVEWVRTQITNL